MRKIAVRTLQIAVTLAAIAWVFRDPKIRDSLCSTVYKADGFWLVMGLLVSGIGHLSNILRWNIFLRVQKIQVTLRHAASLYLIGVFFNLLLVGASGGDIARAFYIFYEQPGKRSQAILSVVADRLIGLVILVPYTLGLVIIRYQWLAQTPVARGLLWFLIVFTVGAALVMAGTFIASRSGLVYKIPRSIPGREGILRTAEACSLFLRARRQMLACVALSIPELFCVFGAFYCAARAYHADVPLADMFSIMPVVAVITSFPISLSGVGIREELFKNLLGDLSHISGGVAVLISLAGFAIYVFWGMIGAVVYACYKKQVATDSSKVANHTKVESRLNMTGATIPLKYPGLQK